MSDTVQAPHSSVSRHNVGSGEELRLPNVPANEVSRVLHETPEDARRVPCLSPLAAALIKAYEQEGFVSALATLIDKGGASGIQRLWGAAQEILERGPRNRCHIAWSIASEVSRARGRGLPVNDAQPPRDVAASYTLAHVREPFLLLRFFHKEFSLQPLEVVASPVILRNASPRFIGSYLQGHYRELISDPSRQEKLATVLRTIALRRDLAGLETCRFIRDRYESIRAWSGQERECQFLWELRDALTKEVLASPLSCERNLKLAELYPETVPHPCLDDDAQPMLSCERWILEDAGARARVDGWRKSLKLSRQVASSVVMSTAFVPLAQPISAPVRWSQPGQSKFDLDGCVLMPLYDFVGLARPGGKSASPTTEQDPRTWSSTADKVRFQQSRILAAFNALSGSYWAGDVPDRARERARDFLRALVVEFPYATALAAPHCRLHGEAFSRDMLRIAREEALRAVEGWSDAPEARQRLRESFVLIDGFGLNVGECSAVALRDLEECLSRAGERELNEYEFTAFLSAARISCATTPSFELHASRLIQAHPNSLGASILTRQLFEVRCPDEGVKRCARSQVWRENMGALEWLNYAHAAVGFGLSEVERAALREIFERRYTLSAQAISRWNPRARSAFRLIVGALYPEALVEARQLRHGTDGLVRSPLEQRVMNRLERMPGVKVFRDRYVPWAPAFDGMLVSDYAQDRPLLLLVDGESFHSVNGTWGGRGFDGHTLLTSRILAEAGYPVVRITAQFGEAGLEGALSDSISDVVRYLFAGTPPTADRLVVDPPETFTDIAGKVILFTPRWARDGDDANREARV